MKIKKLLVMTFLSLMAATGANAQQPYGGCWHPEDIRNWSPETDPDAKFNRSMVPLAKRFKEPELMKANKHQFYEGQICNATILFPTCSMCPSQGANNFLGYQPTYWQYMDKLVYWAGSASEGIIIPPPAGSTDAAHQSGVKSLGQVFFPPYAYGGQQAWVRQMLTKENGKYIYAIKLYEIAKYMGFDGWFINEESGGGSTSEWVDFIKEFNGIADANGDTQMEIQWYNAARTPNEAILKSHKNTSQFLEYGSPDDYRNYAGILGCTEAETFSKIYGGVQVVNSGHMGYTDALDWAMPIDGHGGSLALFCPEERIWKDNVKNLLGTKDECGENAYSAQRKTFYKERDMWVNQYGDPSYADDFGWPGLSGRMLERSVISSMPFETSFCVGLGKHRFVEGEKQNTQDWYHSGVQSIMPTWRYWIENKEGLDVTIDWDDAYNFGSSLKINGKLTAGDHLMRLYKTMIPVTSGGTLRLVYKTSTPGSVEVRLATESKVKGEMVTLSNPTVTDKNGWTIAEYDLSQLNGKTVYMISLNMKSETEVADYVLSLGELAMLPAAYAPSAVAVSNLSTTSVLGEEKGDIRVTWDYSYNSDFDHFDIYTETADGTRKLVGQTRGEGFYIPPFTRNANDAYVNVLVVPVMKDMRQQPAQTLQVKYPAAAAPTVTFKLSKSYINVGETATITAKGTGKPTAWKWTLPEELELVEGALTDSKITVKGLKAGRHSVTVEATNSVGTSTTTKEVLDVMEAGEEKEVYNVVLKKTVVSYSGSTNSTEVPSKIIDGVERPYSTSDKWCNVSADNWVIFDLEGAYRIYGFKIFDGNAGPESGVDQILSYTIELSDDGEHWTTVVDEEDRESESVKTDYIAPHKARYVRLSPHVSGTLRIWEFEVFGKDDNNLAMEVSPTELRLNAEETGNIVVKYDLNGDERSEKFTCRAVAEKGNVTVGDITENTAEGTFTIPVTADKIMGADKLTITVDNGGMYKERSVNVLIDSESQPNVLAGKEATLRHYKADYSFEAQYDELKTGKLTDGNTTDEGCGEIETPSMFKKDFWTIFTAPEGKNWNISKVKIYIPGENQAENDNGKSGAANNEISIMMGNDLTNLTEVKTFAGLDKVSELEYILPEYKSCKYLAIVCTLNPYFYPTLAEVEAFEQFPEAVPLNGPVAVTGWSHDVIAESKDMSSSVNGTLDDQGWVLYSTSVAKTGAVAGDDRIVKTSAGTEFKLADYTQNNALVLKTADESKDLVFDEPANCEELYFLMISANGRSEVETVANYEDGTQSELSEFRPDDWYGMFPSGDEAVYGISRIITKNADNYIAGDIDTRYSFRLYEFTMPTDKSKRIKSVTFTSKKSSSYPTILGIAKKGFYVPTGIVSVDTEEGADEIQGIYNINGMRLNAPQRGINIIKYKNGSTKKVIIR